MAVAYAASWKMEFWTATISILTALVFLLLWLKILNLLFDYYRLCRSLSVIPSPITLPKRHWLLGHIPYIYKQDETLVRKLVEHVNGTAKALGGGGHLFKLWVGPVPIVVVAHPMELSELLKEPKARLMYKPLLPWLGEGLLIAKGNRWSRNRHLLTPAFHYEILKGYIPVYNSCLRVLLEKWMQYSLNGEAVSLFDSLSLLSLDVIMRCALSFRSNCQESDVQLPYVRACSELVRLCSNRGLNPVMLMDWIFWVTPQGRRTKELCELVHEYAEEIIAKRREVITRGTENENSNEEKTIEKKYMDFLDILLMARDEEGRGMSDLEIRNEVDTFMFEGHDTTTSGMSWTLYCLAQHPQHQDKIREEVRSVLKGREWLEYEDLKQLNYTSWCIKEAMRLYSPVFYFFRESTREIRIGSRLVPKGSTFLISPLLIHHNSLIWENPEKYDPLRFRPSGLVKRGPYDYIPFSAGSRNCIGQNFAMNEMKVVIATVVQRVSLAVDESHPVEMVPRVVLRSKNDIKLFVKSHDP